MRISSNLFFQTGLNSINAQQADLVHLYKQVGSGKRMVTPSDDPLAAAQAINVSQTLAMGERYAANRQVASRNLGTEDNVLRTVTLQLQDVKTRLVEAGNGTMSDVDRSMLSEVLQAARDSLLNLANSTDGNGQYLFSGSKGNTPAFNDAGQYMGDSSQRLIQVDQTRQLAGADLGIDIFSRAAPGTTGFVTIPGAGNSGTGVFGKTVVTDASGGTAIGKKVDITFEVDGSGGLQYQVYLDGVRDTSGPYPYTDDTNTLLGGAYGVSVDFSGVPNTNPGDTFTLIPQNTNYSVSKDSTMSIANVSKLNTSDPFTIGYDVNGDYTVEPSPLVITQPGSAEKPVLVIGDGSGNVIGEVALYGKPTPGSEATISPGSGSTSRDEFNVFATLDEIIAALATPTTDPVSAAKFQNSLNSALQRIDVTYDNIQSVSASVGTRMVEVEALNASGSSRVMEYRNQLSQLEDLDYYTAITQLQLRTTALEAAATAFQKIQNTSLFNMNR
ncbi:flagellar hook-associated protein FlgL [Achromobacter sp. F4_2707]|uniref:flagellar hook-associated protein FlgL n=1 Tax=Achromobacter sp. F4_2707 TaxID=3114286 RepID=UPI0039C5C472